jgi:hypothetical protein
MSGALKLSAANEPHFLVMDASTLGTLGGKCFRALCRATGANWFHARHRRYYCASCAAEINETRFRAGEVPACVKRA